MKIFNSYPQIIRYNFQPYYYISGQLSLAIPMWVGPMSTSQRAVTPRGWGVA